MIIESELAITADLDAMMPGHAEDAPRTSWYLSYYKGCIDTTVALLLLVTTTPLILLLMVLVRPTSRGPALYSQWRLGRGGAPYKIYKIRTMVHNCEQTTGPQWSTPDDPRVTPIGRFLRRSHLDELPQLWNVLCGHMSLVGPRPERPEFVCQLERTIPNYRERLSVRPGITGLAQVQLPPDEDWAGVKRKVDYDLCYIQKVTPWLDLRILLGTALKVAGVPFHVIRRELALSGVADDAPAMLNSGGLIGPEHHGA